MSYSYFKRGCDWVASAAAIIVLSPILLATTLAIKLESRGPVIFKQERLGLKGKPFKIYKFRSMVVGAEKQGTGVYSYKGDARITKVGRFIRATSLDELPQLFNILKGEMSLIGPRPALTYHPWTFDKYTEHQKRMFDVLPGITGWAPDQRTQGGAVAGTYRAEYLLCGASFARAGYADLVFYLLQGAHECQ